MSTVRYDGDHTINQQLTEAGVVTLPTFLSPAEESSSVLIDSFFKEGVSLADVVKEKAVPALRGRTDEELKSELKRKLEANPTWRKLIREKRMSVGIVDMSDDSNVKYAALNGRHMMYAASLPKIAVLAAAHDAIERGELKETAEVKRDMLLMIAKSNNAATTRMIDRVGFAHIERTMTDPSLKLYDPAFGGGLWVGKRYAAGGKRSPDPMKGISHAATTEQICRYFYLLANNQLVSEESSEKMRRYLVDPQLHHKFVNTLDRVAPDAKVYRKSGSWSSFHADVAMVQGPGRNYIMTALVDDPAGEQICRELAAVLDGMLKQ
ncbi:serine hydrolase [Neolewinella aurantiaca]|uniref:beta-lactamase n=2 Tax=Neolewinella aurantiaca TaxID=2602767 RepID=A0A5C7FX63_9BACT|nr:serine hydrolase [Neolewinella aurantiaca]